MCEALSMAAKKLPTTTLGAHFLGTHSAHYPRFVEETTIAG